MFGASLQRRKSVVSSILFICLCAGALAQSSGTFTNPLLPSGPDPWVTYKDGYYYYTNSTQNNLTLWKTRSVVDLKNAIKKVVWTPPATGPYSHDIWAPEIHFLDGKWYIYFAADARHEPEPSFVGGRECFAGSAGRRVDVQRKGRRRLRSLGH
jgi:beta-xylosidase